MKKLISTLMTAILILSATTTVFAKDDAKMQSILLSVKERVGSTDEYDVFTSSISENKNYGIRYNFDWSSSDSKNYKSMSITATQSGLITNYYSYKNDDSQVIKPNLNGISIEEAETRTKALIDKLNPDISDKIVVDSEQITQDLYQNGFSFNLKRIENGIEVMNNGGYVSVNKDATEIKNFYIDYDESLTFPSPENIISKSDAQKIYADKLGVMLQYNANHNYSEKKTTVIPVYIPVYNNKYINALLGETTEFSVNSETFGAMKQMSDSAATNSAMRESAEEVQLSETETKEFEKLSHLKSKEELIRIINANTYTSMSKNMVLTWYGTSKDYYEEKYTASLNFENNGEKYEYLNISIDMETGEILSFSRNKNTVYKENNKDVLPDNKIKEIKDTVAFYMAGKKASEYKYSEDDKNFIRYVNGIPFKNNRINVRVSETDGEVYGYSISYNNFDFPALDNIISADEALKSLFSHVDYEVYYAKMSNNNTEASLIYVLDETMPTTIDANTAKLIGYSGKEHSEVFKGYTDISGHYAEDKINTLAKFGIRFEGTECKPDEPIIEKDYIALLIATFKSRSPLILKETDDYSASYKTASREKIILSDEINPTGIVTREIAAKYMIRALGHEEIANIPDIYVCSFNDVENYKGHISILNGLNIINGDGSGNFNPQNSLTRADAIIMIYNYLAR